MAAERSAFGQLVGYELQVWEEGYAKVTLAIAERHLNRSGVLHGGVLMTLIDAACGYAGTFSADPDKPRRGFTLQLSTQFIATVKEGALLTAEARQTGGGAKIFYADCQVHDGEGNLVGSGQGVFRHRRSALR